MATVSKQKKVAAIDQTMEQIAQEEQAKQEQLEKDRQAALQFISDALPSLATDQAVDTAKLRQAIDRLGWSFDDLKKDVEAVRQIRQADDLLADRDDQANGDAIREAEARILELRKEIGTRRNKASLWSSCNMQRGRLLTRLREKGLTIA